jgi:hypothetical protein
MSWSVLALQYLGLALSATGFGGFLACADDARYTHTSWTRSKWSWIFLAVLFLGACVTGTSIALI